MLKKILLFLLIIMSFYSCGSYQKINENKNESIDSKIPNKAPSLVDKIVWTAVSFKGTPYKYGGTNNKGMDCSGLIFTSFKKRKILLPRSSRLMYTKGIHIKLNEAKRGDLLFFKTSRKKTVNHVGLITSTEKGKIQFIHATSSKGVLVSYLSEKYWKRAFVGAKRVIHQ